MNDIIIDLGANMGGFSLEVAKRNPEITVHAVEPYPQLAIFLKEETEKEKISNHIIHEIAISEKNGKSNFNISTESEFGTSSLLDFSTEHLNTDEYWSNRIDLIHSNKINVETMTLSSFLDRLSFNRIRFIKIDIQGMDLIALKTGGKYIDRIDGGMLEVPSVKHLSLYSGTDDDLLSALLFLDKNNFYAYKIKPNDPASNEFNIFFCRKGKEYELMENELNLRGLKYYDGKHYWHFPSNRQEFPEVYIIELTNKLNDIRKENDRLNIELSEVNEKLTRCQTEFKNLKSNFLRRVINYFK
ncbi:FkbM family methyltransferase [Yersinia hibernica]|uniref:FkbM family methyltransferase n=1 Tax=Yersinia hibernica TaxID=2339259 RepID=A0ABX5R0N0_9GAMM|nr:FkbM family methyltransferase [Yersinia hibernica]QAX79180.1 FkbM family methyltransferase [Yersinia hibernica]